jgi:beta-glucoside PTS system EIICBA component
MQKEWGYFMSNEELSKEVLSKVGGQSNISNVTHCATRLRLRIINEDKVSEDELKSISGILGLAKNNNEYQVIIGTGVESVYLDFMKLLDSNLIDQNSDETKIANEAKKNKRNYFLVITDFIAGSVLPTLPVIVAGGMISAVLVTLSTFFGFSKDVGAYKVLEAVYDAAFGFLPIFVGYNAAKKLNISPMLGALLGAVLVEPGINGVEGLDFFGIPITAANYSNSVLPVIFSVVFMALVYKPLEKWIPKEIKFFTLPLLTMLVAVPVSITLIGPIATWLGAVIGDGLLWLNLEAGWLSVGIMGGITSFLIFTGTGTALYPAIFLAFSENGFENFVMPGMLAGNIAIGGAAIATMTMLKKKETKALAMSSGLTAVFGITEPAVFGVLARFKKPFVGAIIGGGIGGIFAGIMHIAEYAFVSPGVASIIAFINPDGTMTNLLMTIVTIILGFSSGFIATRLIGIDEKEGEI